MKQVLIQDEVKATRMFNAYLKALLEKRTNVLMMQVSEIEKGQDAGRLK